MSHTSLTGGAATLLTRLPFLGPIYKDDAMTYRRLKAGVSHVGRNALSLDHDGLPIPPIKLRDMVRRGGILAEDFLLEGKQAFDAVMEFAQEQGVALTPDARVYEFGVGCGRVARHFLTRQSCRFTGSDVDEELIAWCGENLASALGGRAHPEFFVNAYQPPLAAPENSFDFIYSISVLTHMTAESQSAWLSELHRVLAHGGHLALSILEKSTQDVPSGIATQERIDREYERGWLGRAGAPATYFNSYNTLAYMRDVCPALELVGYRHNAIRNTQSLLMFRKRTGA